LYEQKASAASRGSAESLEPKEAALLQEATATVEALTRDLAQRDAEVAEATQRIGQLKEEAAALTIEIQRLYREAEDSKALEQEREADLERVRGALASARDQLAAARALSGKVDELNALLDAEHDRADQLEEQVHDKREAAALLQEATAAALVDARQENAALRTEVEVLRRANASLAAPEVFGTGQNTAAATRDVLGPDGRRRRIGEILLNTGYITEDQLEDALHDQVSRPQRRIGTILVEKGYVSEEAVAQTVARQFDLPFVRLTGEMVDVVAPRLINGQLAKHRQCIPITAASDRVVLAMANPQDLIALDDVELASGRRVMPVVATASDISAAIVRYYGAS
jgi:regulator of replication initiation timing